MKRSTQKLIRDYSLTILVAISVAIFIRRYVIEAYRIPTQAMSPTLLAGDTIFVDKYHSHLKNSLPSHGEIIVFSAPSDSDPGQLSFIRRVIGLPGDEISMKDGFVFLNGKKLATSENLQDHCFEELMPQGHSYKVCREPTLLESFGPEKVPAGSVFVLGDFRTQTGSQKRSWRWVPVSAIQGTALWVWLSLETYPKDLPYRPFIPRFRWDRMFMRIK